MQGDIVNYFVLIKNKYYKILLICANYYRYLNK